MSQTGLHKSAKGLLLVFSGAGPIGPGTGRPIGLTAGQLVQMLVNTKSYSITSSLISGNTIDRPDSTPSSWGFFIDGSPGFTDTISSGSNNVQFDTFANSAYVNPGDGLIYPTFRLIAGDGTNEVATNATGAASGSTLVLFGSPVFNIPISHGTLSPTAFVIDAATLF